MAKPTKGKRGPGYKKKKPATSTVNLLDSAQAAATPSQSGTTSVARVQERDSAKLIEQERAKFALDQLNKALAKPESDHYKHRELKSYARRLPAMIQTNGFGQAMAFYYAKRDKFEAYGELYNLVEAWLCRKGEVYSASDVAPKLLHGITGGDQHAYRRAQAETLALMIWVKTFAEALIESGNKNAQEAAQ